MNTGTTVRCPALLISSIASGQGKTTLTAALARLHTRAGRRVRVFKCGPDFLDPYWHELASGAPVHSVDLWMTGEGDARQRMHEAAQQADLILLEGVMGLFDGGAGAPTAADLAQKLGLPVLAVIDASAMAGSFGAVALGLQQYQPELRWAGMLANRVASSHHADLLRTGLRDEAMWLGALPPVQLADAALAGKGGRANLLPERHLGLIAAHELPDAMARLDAAADALAQTVLGQMDWAQWQQRWSVEFASPQPPQLACAAGKPLLQGRRIAIARDAAFSFIYPANLECLREWGAELLFFSPLAGDDLPDCDALWLPGGYPELHLPALQANIQLQCTLKAHCAQGKPVWAECGGMVALAQSLTDLNGEQHALWGVLPAQAVMQQRLAGLGMQQLATPWGLVHGHTFHYSRLECLADVEGELTELTRTSRPGQDPQADRGEAFYRLGSVYATYFHAWFASCPEAVAALFGADTPPDSQSQAESAWLALTSSAAA